jgi:hypothetical protein
MRAAGGDLRRVWKMRRFDQDVETNDLTLRLV